MVQSEEQYKDQSRSNIAYGKECLKYFEINKNSYIADPAKFSKQKRALISILGSIKGKTILEYGSGQGLFSIYLSKLGAKVIGVDIGEDLIKLSKKAAKLNSVKCDFYVCNIKKLSFANETFDFVVGNGVLHHLPKSWLKDSLVEAFRVLKPGGHAIFTEPIENNKLFNFIQNIIPVGKPDSPQYRPSILQRKRWKNYLNIVDDRSLTNKELIEAKGSFKSVSIDYYGFFIRLSRLCPHTYFIRILEAIDIPFNNRFSPLKKLSQCVLVKYSK